MIEQVLMQKLPSYKGTVRDAVTAAHEGCKRATAALKAQDISLVPGGLLLHLDISPFLGNPALLTCNDPDEAVRLAHASA
jgi:hypothetical protein